MKYKNIKIKIKKRERNAHRPPSVSLQKQQQKHIRHRKVAVVVNKANRTGVIPRRQKLAVTELAHKTAFPFIGTVRRHGAVPSPAQGRNKISHA